MGRLYSFMLRVARGFIRNQGMLLSGAVAYYTLLSIVPLSILALVALTHLIEEQQLVQALSTYLDMVIPGYCVFRSKSPPEYDGSRHLIPMHSATRI